MWASTSSTQLSWAFCRHTSCISRQQERHHDALAATPAIFIPRPFASASASASVPASASASEKLRKPEVIEWQENMPINNATFIGTVVRDMQIQYLDSGKIVANSSMKVKRLIRNHSWFYLEFWGDLAEVAAAHLKIDDQIFVSGSVWPESVKGRDGLQKTFVKKTERHPDFKHMFTGRGLWLDSKLTPDWVKERLMKEVAVPKSPDFKNKLSGKPLWIDDANTPV